MYKTRQSFKKYYRSDEIICSITKKNRLKRCYVFFAIKNDVDSIKREEFNNPKRDDKYGTSVISIQFDRGRLNNVSIKNRYNHFVKNPDSTFDNNLENIIPGLTKSFEKYYGLNIIRPVGEVNFINLLPYVKANNNKYYRYNCEFDSVYYCENNIIVDHGIVIDKYAKSKERFILIDYYVIDRKEKTIYLYDKYMEDNFVDSINLLGTIKYIIVVKNNDIKIIKIICDNNKCCEIKVDSKNKIISYINEYSNLKGDSLSYSNHKKL